MTALEWMLVSNGKGIKARNINKLIPYTSNSNCKIIVIIMVKETRTINRRSFLQATQSLLEKYLGVAGNVQPFPPEISKTMSINITLISKFTIHNLPRLMHKHFVI